MKGERLYRWLLGLYPRGFRERFEESMVEAFHEERARRSAFRFWLFVGWDLLSSAARCWWVALRTAASGAELRHATRALGRERGFTFATIATLALGIGATTAVYTVVDTVLMRPLPYPDAARLVRIWDRHEEIPFFSVTIANFFAWRGEREIFEAVGAYREDGLNVVIDDEADRIPGARVTAELFDVLGASPARGRLFTKEEDTVGGPQAVILSHELWTSRFGGRDVVGRRLEVSGEPATVVGILPPGFEIPQQPKARLFVPYRLEDTPEARGAHFLRVLARLRAGVSLEEATAAMGAVSERLAASWPDTNRGWSVVMLSLRDATVGDAEPPLYFLLAAVGCLFLITLVNASNLLVGRTTARARELAVRAALGAGRARLVGHVSSESLLVASVGGMTGLGLAAASVRLLPAIVPEELPRQSAILIDFRHALFAALLGVVAAAAIGLIPAWTGARRALSDSFGRFRASRRLGRLLVASEVALATTLVVVSGLLVRSFQELKHVELGFDAENVVTMEVSPVASLYPNPPDRARLYRALVERFEGEPYVLTAGVVHRLPLDGDSGTAILIEGEPLPPAGGVPSVSYRAIGGDYFGALGIRLERGRLFTPEEVWERGDAVIINEAASRRFWPSRDAVGTRLRASPESPWSVVVGIVSDARESALREPPEPMLYLPYARAPVPGMVLVARASGNVSLAFLAAAARDVFREVDPRQPVSAIATLPSHVDRVLGSPRFIAMGSGAFALASLLLAALGIHAVVSRAVAARSHEMGVRIALGAGRDRVVSLVLGEGMRPVLVGILLGVGAAFLVASLVSDLTFGVGAVDSFAFVVMPLFLAMVALASNLVPALAAAKVDPIETLRSL